jgi:hypothetical protein
MARILPLLLALLALAPATISLAAECNFPETNPTTSKFQIKDPSAAKRKVTFKVPDHLGRLGATFLFPLFCDAYQNCASTRDLSVQVFNANGGADSSCWTLPKESFTPVFDPTGHWRGFTYKDVGQTASPVSKASYDIRKSLTIKASAKNPVQPISYTLDEPMQGVVGITFSYAANACTDACGPCLSDAECGGAVGSCQPTTFRMCFLFAPRKDEPGVFIGQDDGGAAACPTPPPCVP